jgi:hypothetical protein
MSERIDYLMNQYSFTREEAQWFSSLQDTNIDEWPDAANQYIKDNAEDTFNMDGIMRLLARWIKLQRYAEEQTND